MNKKMFKGFCVLTVLALIVPGLVWGATAKKGVKKTSIAEQKPDAPAAVTAEQNPAAPSTPGKLDKRWIIQNQQIMELVKEKKFDEGLKNGLATLDYLKESKLLDGQEAATTYNNLGMIYLMKGQYANAQMNLAKALNLRTRIYGDTSLEVATVWLNISELYKMQAQYIFQLHKKKAEELNNAEGAITKEPENK